MTSLLETLPAPLRAPSQQGPTGGLHPASTAFVAPKATKEPPPYGSAERLRYVPRRPEDYGDGGAFPEVHVGQYPLDMGRKDRQAAGGAAGNAKAGQVRFFLLVEQGGSICLAGFRQAERPAATPCSSHVGHARECAATGRTGSKIPSRPAAVCLRSRPF
jgi:hypothetical protein